MQQLYQELKSKFVRRETLYRRMEVGWPGWYMSVCFWWNERVKYGVGGRTLYLWGNAGVGKSVCVEKICRMHDEYQPVPGNVFFGDYKSSEIVLFEEFSWERFKCNYPQLKRLLEGKSSSVNQKCKDSRIIRAECPVIMVTNETFVDEAFSKRCRIIHAKEAYWKKEACLVPEVKEEPVENLWEEIEISSSPLEAI
jgi:hypothetical protein